MRLANYSNDNTIFNLERLTSVKYHPSYTDVSEMTGNPINVPSKLIMYFGGDVVRLEGDEAERVWSHLVKQSYVIV